MDATSDLVFTSVCRLVRDRSAAPVPVDTKNIPSIKVSWDQKLSTYIYRAKRLLTGAERVSVSGIGMAITSVVMCAEILRNSGFVDIVSVETSMLRSKSQNASAHQKPVLEIVVERTPRFHELLETENATRAARRAERERRGAGNTAFGRRDVVSEARADGAPEDEYEEDVDDEDANDESVAAAAATRTATEHDHH